MKDYSDSQQYFKTKQQSTIHVTIDSQLFSRLHNSQHSRLCYFDMKTSGLDYKTEHFKLLQSNCQHLGSIVIVNSLSPPLNWIFWKGPNQNFQFLFSTGYPKSSAKKTWTIQHNYIINFNVINLTKLEQILLQNILQTYQGKFSCALVEANVSAPLYHQITKQPNHQL